MARYRVVHREASYKLDDVRVVTAEWDSDLMQDLGDFIQTANPGDLFSIEVVEDSVTLTDPDEESDD